MFNKPKKRIGRRGFKIDRQATEGLRTVGYFTDPRSFRSTSGHDLLYGVDMSCRRKEVHDKAHGRCQLISTPRCRGFASLADGEADHIVSRGMGGSDDLENLRWTCGPCHRQRHVHPRWGAGRQQAIRDFESVNGREA